MEILNGKDELENYFLLNLSYLIYYIFLILLILVFLGINLEILGANIEVNL
jgi:hypothetical protein